MIYDIAIVGGGTAGCAAAYIAGKLGLKSIIIEKNIHLGGTITSGLVIPIMQSGENQINTDFYNDLVLELKAVNGQITYQGNQGWFNPELLKIVLDNMMSKVGVDILFNTMVTDVSIENKKINRLYLNNNLLSVCNDKLYCQNKMLSVYIDAKYVIDSTGNCEIGKFSNCEFLENHENIQPPSLRFIMENVNVKEFADWICLLDSNRDVTTSEYIGNQCHCSTAYTWDSAKKWALAPLFEDAVKNKVLKDTDRNYFQVFSIAGMSSAIAFNCPRIIDDIDFDDGISISNAIMSARAAILRLSNFCKLYLKGFENSYISNIADMLGVRASRRIKGKYVYTIEDLKSGKKVRASCSYF
jgi:ribulose 1,5-bisphosphate synthetase/thiazole synthase